MHKNDVASNDFLEQDFSMAAISGGRAADHPTSNCNNEDQISERAVVSLMDNGFRNSLTERQLLTPTSHMEFKPSEKPSNSTRVFN